MAFAKSKNGNNIHKIEGWFLSMLENEQINLSEEDVLLFLHDVSDSNKND